MLHKYYPSTDCTVLWAIIKMQTETEIGRRVVLGTE